MKVFHIETCGRYGEGMCVVAAADLEAAIKLASTIDDGMWNTRYFSPRNTSEIGGIQVSGEPRVLTHFEETEA